jgi:transcriptional regulator with XRE-family HTH domain
MADLAVGAELDVTGLLGAAIRERRSSLQISQDELAVRAGLHRTYLSDVERGARNPSIKTIEKIAHALQVPVAKLFEDHPLSRKME